MIEEPRWHARLLAQALDGANPMTHPTLRHTLNRLHQEGKQEESQRKYDMVAADLITAKITIEMHLDGADNADLATAAALIDRAMDTLATIEHAPKELMP